MLKVVKVHKRYKSKKGTDHHALKGIDLDLGSRGFVFVLGKSGCGKSTLLNVLGGLDKFDSGDIIIKGKSSKNFKVSEWDSYRNTYLGFVFQEFNLIENYTISKNIRLALELQSHPKKDIKKRVREILKQVGLEDLSRRKPNELSGGQKQRIAIARALVKDPEIILADEPTGNLDSETGKQIVEILRKLAEKKLVIMVSHDKNTAYRYADRIITLSDGEVISDELNTGGWKYIGNSVDHYRTEGEISRVIRIPKGGKLESTDLADINSAIKNEKSVVYVPITKGEPLNAGDLEVINKFARGQGEVFIPIAKEVNKIQGTTNESYKDRVNPAEASIAEEHAEKFKLIKSKLPFKDSFKMALNSLFRKKVKLIFTILLFLVSLGMFGFSETVTRFNFSKSVAISYEDGNQKIISLTKTLEVTQPDGWKTDITIPFELDDVDEMINSYDGISYGLGYNFVSTNKLDNTSSDFVSASEFVGFLELENLDSLDLELEYGKFPSKYNEIIISDFIGAYLVSENSNYTTNQNLIGKKITIDYNSYTISGILKTDYKDYEALNNFSPMQLQQDMLLEVSSFSEKNSNIYSRVIVKAGFYENYGDKIEVLSEVVNFQIDKDDPENEWDIYNWLSNSMYKYDSSMLGAAIKEGDLFVKSGFTGLADDEIIVDMYAVQNMLKKDDSTEIEKIVYDEKLSITQKRDQLLNKGYFDFEIDVHEVDQEKWIKTNTRTLKVVGIINFNNYIGKVEAKNLVPILEAKGAKLEDWEKENYWELERMLSDYGLEYDSKYKMVHSPIVVNDKTFNEISPVSANKVSELVINLNSDVDYNVDFFDYGLEKELIHNTAAGGVLGMFRDFTEEAKEIFRYVSLVFALFATVLLFTTISSSVMNKKKEIGILRAIGARGRDVAFIFVTEGIILGVITTILAIVALNIITVIINGNLSEQLGLNLSIFNSSMIIFGEMALMAILIVIVSAFVPVKRVTVMKPIDAIRNK